DHQIRKYVAIQQWFAEKHPVPFYSCIFDNAITDCYSWSISKDGYFIFGGAYPMKDGQTRFTTLKEKMSAFQFQFGKAVKSEKCTVLFPSRWQDFVCGKDNAFLIGEAAGFISASSLEGISYALDSAEILRSVLLKQPEKLNTAYRHATRKLRLKLFGKIVKSRCLTAPALRKWIMRSGVAHIPQLKDYPTRFTSPTSRM
ncbi:MAG: colicin M resistance lipid reductase CbrA, partial [Escherichia coli]|nr:colicin M resistance lipid reductase CbrA [Escherichia coli]